MTHPKVTRLFVVVFIVFSLSTYAGQITWQTTRAGSNGGSCQLESNKIKLTVSPFHVDVEEEAVIATRGSVNWGDPNTLEIVGEFTLTKGTAFRSLLLWNGQRILKAKLKERNAADSAYQQVVDREIPRDPALVEMTGDNTYRFRIYPVGINGSRKIRVLYSVPYQVYNEGPQFRITTVFTAGADQTPTQIPVEIRNSAQTKGNYILSYGSIRKTVDFGATYQIPFGNLVQVQSYWNGWYYNQQTAVQPLILTPDTVTTSMAYTTKVDSGRAAGNYATIFASRPDSITAAINELYPDGAPDNLSLEAKVIAGDNAYITDFNGQSFLGIYLKSTTSWDGTVTWKLFNEKGKEIYRCRQTYTPLTDTLTKRMLPLVWGAKYSLAENLGNLGALYGFVDRQMSLLALESDTLAKADADKYALMGVPPLKPEEIIIRQANMPSIPNEIVFFEFGSGVMRTMKANVASFKLTLLPNRRVALKFPECKSGSVSAKLFDIRGKLVASWDNVRVNGNAAELQLPQAAKGCLILRVTNGNAVMQEKLTVAQ
jgi:hypothetical protein